MAGKNNSGGTSTALQTVQAAEQAAAQARTDAIASIEANRAGLVEQMQALAGQIEAADTELEGLGVNEFEFIDLSNIGYTIGTATKQPRKQRRSSSGSSGSSGARGSKPCSLADGILIAMNQSERGTEFGIADVHEAVQADPVNYPFSGAASSQRTIVNQNLGSLVESKHVKRAGRGVYVLTASGSKAADAALAEMNAPAEDEG